MSVIDKVRFLVYRVHEKGLEIFLLNSGENQDILEMPEMDIKDSSDREDKSQFINLEPIKTKDGRTVKAVAIEGDWHDLPSIRKMFFKDVNTIKSKIKSYLPVVESGTFVHVKDAVSKVIPGENHFIEELKEILAEKNATKNM